MFATVSFGNEIEIGHMSFIRNPWSPIFYGTVVEYTDGTLITGHFKSRSSVKVFMLIWRIFALFMGALLLIGILLNDFDIMSLVLLIVPALMFGFPFAFEKFGVSIGNNDREEVLQFIQKKLFATTRPNERISTG